MNQVDQIISVLKERYPEALCALHYDKDYELMIAVRLSAQCTDARVNLVTPALFERFPTLDAFADADISEVERYVHSCGFYKHKARDIVLACQMLREVYDRKVPDTMQELLKLPGVGRKTANLLLPTVWGLQKAKNRKRSKRSFAPFFRLTKAPLSVIGSSCSDVRYARRGIPSAANVRCGRFAGNFPENNCTKKDAAA